MPDLPKGWTTRRLGFVVEQVRRRVAISKSTQYRMLGIRLWGRGPFIREVLPGSKIAAQYVYGVSPGDIVYTRLFASKGTYALIDEEFGSCFASNEFPTFVVNEERADAEYLIARLTYPRTWEELEVYCSGTTMGSRFRLKERDFLRFPMNLPAVDEQVGVAQVLRLLGCVESGSLEAIRALKQAKQGTMRRLLTRGHPAHSHAMKRLGEPWRIGRVAPNVTQIPEQWELVTLTDVAKLESGHTPSRRKPEYWGGDIPWISLGDTDQLKEPRITSTSETITQAGVDNSSARLLPKHTVVLSRTAVVGLCSMTTGEMTCSQHFAAFVCGKSLVPGYLTQLFRYMQREWSRLKTGSSPTLKDIYFNTFRNLEILLPPTPEQALIADIGEAFDLRIQRERAVLEQLQALKRGLAQALLSGRVRIPPALIAQLNAERAA